MRIQTDSLGWGWMDWHEWAETVIETHQPHEIADSMADLGSQINDLRRGMAAEAQIVQAQVFSMNHKVVGKGRGAIVREQVRRMLKCSIGQGPPRSLGWGRGWVERVAAELENADDSL